VQPQSLAVTRGPIDGEEHMVGAMTGWSDDGSVTPRAGLRRLRIQRPPKKGDGWRILVGTAPKARPALVTRLSKPRCRLGDGRHGAPAPISGPRHADCSLPW
jgi:hypothetical protein